MNEITHTRLETILDRAIQTNKTHFQLTGCSSPLALAFFLSQSYSKKINNLPHFVVVPSYSDALSFQQQLDFFDPTRHSYVLSSFDVSPYSGLQPNSQSSADRIHFLSHALNARPGDIFIADSVSLMQKVMPFRLFNQLNKTIKIGSELSDNISEFLNSLGYEAAPQVEDRGQYAIRGGIVDLFSPAEKFPIRIELFGDQVESLRQFNPADQRSLEEIKSFILSPAKEILFNDDIQESLINRFKQHLSGRQIPRAEADEMIRSLVLKNPFPGIEFLLPFFYQQLETVFDYFSSSLNFWYLDPIEISRVTDEFKSELQNDYRNSQSHVICPPIELLYQNFEELNYPVDSRYFYLSNLEQLDEQDKNLRIEYRTHHTTEFANYLLSHQPGSEYWIEAAAKKLKQWRSDGYRIFVASKNQTHLGRLKILIERMEFHPVVPEDQNLQWDSWLHTQDAQEKVIHILHRHLSESIRIEEERIIFLKDEDFLGKKQRARDNKSSEEFHKQAKRLSFGDLKPGDMVVHVKHGIGQYEGLKMMSIGGVESEYIQVAYKDKDKLYLPVYRVGQLQKYSGAQSSIVLDKLGGIGWEKTKTKVKNTLRDIASELLKLYSARAEMKRDPLNFNDSDVVSFSQSFPYEETNDQLKSINDIEKDLLGFKPMDRLVCGDVGFGKTEVAMRAAFMAVAAKKQVAILAPTTVLSFQHFETFKKRFHGWPVQIAELNRFVSNADAKKTVTNLKEGKVDIVIGTHRILSKDVIFKDLGLLIVDEEQKFGVTHKEKIKKLKLGVDTLTLSATPIPRTLNMSLMGVRDLSIINTAPVDRLPTRTYVSKFNEETIRKAIESEVSRGGQVYFIHNRVQSIYGVADELRRICPRVRLRVAHGQMDEEELEKTMLAFFNHEVDVLVSTAIVESGMDVPRANTIFIDDAHMFGLSQLYQLRGRVGRSKTRAYCYLLMPKDKKLDQTQQERLKIIQENTALGSGFKIAQYDLELRGAGNILGDEQSGHVNSVGYELYMDLLNEAIADAKGEAHEDLELDPEINLRIPAMIPDKYIPDIRIRLSYYKALAEIKSHEELDQIEDELKDQFGEIPEPTVNLMGLMLIRRQCKDLGVRDISAGVKTISLIFTEKTKLKPEKVIQLAMRENKKYSITPDNRLNIRMNQITWSAVYEELGYLLRGI